MRPALQIVRAVVDFIGVLKSPQDARELWESYGDYIKPLLPGGVMGAIAWLWEYPLLTVGFAIVVVYLATLGGALALRKRRSAPPEPREDSPSTDAAETTGVFGRGRSKIFMDETSMQGLNRAFDLDDESEARVSRSEISGRPDVTGPNHLRDGKPKYEAQAQEASEDAIRKHEDKNLKEDADGEPPHDERKV